VFQPNGVLGSPLENKEGTVFSTGAGGSRGAAIEERGPNYYSGAATERARDPNYCCLRPKIGLCSQIKKKL
jgi:hypothetical protein